MSYYPLQEILLPIGGAVKCVGNAPGSICIRQVLKDHKVLSNWLLRAVAKVSWILRGGPF